MNLSSLQDAELECRLRQAWGKLFALKADLSGKQVGLRQRLKYFNAHYTNCFIWASILDVRQRKEIKVCVEEDATSAARKRKASGGSSDLQSRLRGYRPDRHGKRKC